MELRIKLRGRCHRIRARSYAVLTSGSPAKSVYDRRVAAGLSQARLADAAGVSTKTLWSLENGGNYTAKSLARIQSALDFIEQVLTP